MNLNNYPCNKSFIFPDNWKYDQTNHKSKFMNNRFILFLWKLRGMFKKKGCTWNKTDNFSL